MTFLREVLREKPSALYMMDDTTPFQDYSSYNRVGISVGTAPTLAPALVRGAQYSQVFNSGSTAKFETPLFRQGYESQSFTLEAAARRVGKSTNKIAQATRTNLAYNPIGINSGQANVSWEYSTRSSWTSSWITGATDSPLGKTTYNRETSPASIQTAVSARGTDLYVNVDLGTPTFDAKANAQPVTIGETVTISVWVRYSTATQVVIPYRIHNGAGAWLNSTTSNSNTTVPANTWTRVSRTIVVDATGYLAASFRTNQTQDWPANSTMDITGIMIEKGATNPSYFDGSLPGYEWAGTTNASNSRTRSDVSYVNGVTNPRAVTTGYATVNAAGGVATGTFETTAGPTAINVPTWYKATFTTAPTSSPIQTGQSGANRVAVTEGQVWSFGAWGIANDIPTAGMRLDIQWISPSGANLTATNGVLTAYSTANVWELRTQENVTVPAGAAFAALRITMSGPQTNFGIGDWFGSTGYYANRGATLLPYTDGAQSGAAWSGTANNSETLMMVSSGSQQILSNLSQYDGLTINGTVVSFGTKYLTTGSAVATYDLQQDRAVILHGVHTADKNSLYVDGVLVSEVSITPAQQADQFVATDAYLYSGTTTASQSIALNGVGVYPFALASDAVARHAVAARALPRGEEVVAGMKGDYIPMSLSNSDLFLDQWWSTALDWETAQLSNVAVKQDRLVPQFDNITNVSLPGSWLDTFAMDNSGAISIYGVSLNWDGVGATVEVSLDGTTWEAASRGRKVALIPPGYNPTGKELQLRISFPGGIVGDTSYVDNLNVVGLKTGTPPTVAGRTITLTGAHQERDYLPTVFHDNWGVEIDAGGTVVMSADTSADASVIRTLEMWIKSLPGSNPTVSISGTYYQNGAVATATLPTGQWTLFHIVAPSDVSTGVTITGPAQLGQVGVYNTALTATEVAAIYATYVGTNYFTAPDSSTIIITESNPACKIYASDWAIQPAG